jgi:hypothetical protein
MREHALPGDDIVRIELVKVIESPESNWDWELRFLVHCTYNAGHEEAHVSSSIVPQGDLTYGHSLWAQIRRTPRGRVIEAVYPKGLKLRVLPKEAWSSAVNFRLWNNAEGGNEYYVEHVYPLKRRWNRTRQ